MGYHYKYLQSNFSGGQLDPMIESNLNNGLRAIGVKESYNTIHNTNKTISRRPGVKYQKCMLRQDNLYGHTNAVVVTPIGNMGMVIFSPIIMDDPYSPISIVYEGRLYQAHGNLGVFNSTSVFNGPLKTATYKNYLFVAGDYIDLCAIFRFDYDNGSDTWSFDLFYNKDAWILPEGMDKTSKFNDVCIAGGRLFFAVGNRLFASTTRNTAYDNQKEEDADDNPVFWEGFPKWFINYTMFEETHLTSPDEVNPDNPGAVSEDIKILINDDHAIEVIETDMYASDIQWIAYIGRIIVATQYGIFISTSQEISPNSFDLVLTSTIGSSSLHAQVVNNQLVFTSYDRTRLYVGSFSYESQGLQVIEISTSVKNLIYDRIKHFEAFDYPEISVYVATEDGDNYFCQPTFESDSLVWSWSQWQLAYHEDNQFWFDYFFVDKTESEPVMYCFLKDKTRSDNSQFMYLCKLQWQIVYDKDKNKDKYYLDYQTVFDYAHDTNMFEYIESEVPGTPNQLRIDLAQVPYTKDGVLANLMALAFGKTTVVIKRRVSDDIEEFAYSVHDDCIAELDTNTLRTVITVPNVVLNKDENEHLRQFIVTIGFPFTTRITLFKPLLPNNSGVALWSRHGILSIAVKVFHSFGGSLLIGGEKVASFPYFYFGKDVYNDNQISPETKLLYSNTGIIELRNPAYSVAEHILQDGTKFVQEDDIGFVADEIYPFNLMAISIDFNVTETT